MIYNYLRAMEINIQPFITDLSEVVKQHLETIFKTHMENAIEATKNFDHVKNIPYFKQMALINEELTKEVTSLKSLIDEDNMKKISQKINELEQTNKLLEHKLSIKDDENVHKENVEKLENIIDEMEKKYNELKVNYVQEKKEIQDNMNTFHTDLLKKHQETLSVHKDHISNIEEQYKKHQSDFALREKEWKSRQDEMNNALLQKQTEFTLREHELNQQKDEMNDALLQKQTEFTLRENELKSLLSQSQADFELFKTISEKEATHNEVMVDEVDDEVDDGVVDEVDDGVVDEVDEVDEVDAENSEVDQEEENEEEAEVMEMEIDGKKYYVENEIDGPVFEYLKDEEVGDEIGTLKGGKLFLN